MASDPLLVAVSSPQPIVHAGLTTLLSRHPDRLRVVAWPDGEGDPDVLLFDVMALLHDDDLQPALVARSTGARVLAVSRDLRPELAARAAARGIDGTVSLGASEDELVAAVEATARGESDPGVVRPGADVGLTERETEVLGLITRGFTNQEIARALFLSPNSIKTYVRTAYRKIGAASRSQAVGWAIRHGFPTDREDGAPRHPGQGPH